MQNWTTAVNCLSKAAGQRAVLIPLMIATAALGIVQCAAVGQPSVVAAALVRATGKSGISAVQYFPTPAGASEKELDCEEALGAAVQEAAEPSDDSLKYTGNESDAGLASANNVSTDSLSDEEQSASSPQTAVSDSAAGADNPVDSCLVRETCTDAQWEEITALWNMIPGNLRENFESDGWTMVATSDDFWTAYGYGRIAALTVYSAQRCYIRADNSRLAVCVAHEFGHYIDQTNGWPSKSDEFIAIYHREKDGFSGYLAVDDHYTSDAQEYFAQVFCQIITAPDTADSAPDSFAFVQHFFDPDTF